MNFGVRTGHIPDRLERNSGLVHALIVRRQKVIFCKDKSISEDFCATT